VSLNFNSSPSQLNVQIGRTTVEELSAFQRDPLKSPDAEIHATPNPDGSYTLYQAGAGPSGRLSEPPAKRELAQTLIKDIVLRRLPGNEFEGESSALLRRIDQRVQVQELGLTLRGAQPAPATPQRAVALGRLRIHQRHHAARQQTLGANMRRDLASTEEGVRGWRARNVKVEGREMGVGATGSSVSFTRFLGGAASAVNLAKDAVTGLAGTSVALSGADALISGYGAAKSARRAGHWSSLQQAGDLGRATGLRDELKGYRGQHGRVLFPHQSEARFALDPSGRTEGRSHVGTLNQQQQQDQLTRIGLYAERKMTRKAVRKAYDSTMSTAAFTFGALSLATGAITPPGILFGTLSMGFGIARGASKIGGWIKAAGKAAVGTLGKAREQNAKALLQLAISPESKVKDQALAALQKLGVSPEAVAAATEDSQKRREMIVTIMDLMHS